MNIPLQLMLKAMDTAEYWLNMHIVFFGVYEQKIYCGTSCAFMKDDPVQVPVQASPILYTICRSIIICFSLFFLSFSSSNVIIRVCFLFFHFFWDILGLGASPSGLLLDL